jgi:hypothetical protein
MTVDKNTQAQAYSLIERTIGGCFGSADCEFAGHPNDKAAAKEIKKLVTVQELDKGKVQKLIEKFLYKEEVSADHLKNQVELAIKFFYS